MNDLLEIVSFVVCCNRPPPQKTFYLKVMGKENSHFGVNKT